MDAISFASHSLQPMNGDQAWCGRAISVSNTRNQNAVVAYLAAKRAEMEAASLGEVGRLAFRS